MTKFILGARELELDAVASEGDIMVWAVSEHVEDAGVHSGDATHILPSDTLPQDIIARVYEIGGIIARALKISGPMNMQFLWKDGAVSVIECNLRASRSFPFVSKVFDIDFLEVATHVFLGRPVTPNPHCMRPLPYVGVKAPQFSFQRLTGSDPILGVEMASTGEVATLGRDKYEAFLKSYLAVPNNFKLTKRRHLALSGNLSKGFSEPLRKLLDTKGYKVFITPESLAKLGWNEKSHKNIVLQKTDRDLINTIKKRNIDLSINFNTPNEDPINYEIRRTSVDFSVPVLSNERVATFMLEAISRFDRVPVESYEDFYGRQSKAVSPEATYVEL
jgi:hypothetical protein